MKNFLLTLIAIFSFSFAFSQFCDEAQGTPGFPSDPTCEASICAADPFCCNDQWDGVCATAAETDPACSACLSTATPPPSGTIVPFTGSNTIACGTNTQLTDHNGAANYDNSANGFTVLEAAGSAVVNISGTYNTESGFDNIRIYNGTGTGGTLLETYTGTGTANFTGSPGQTVTVQFTSDGSVTNPGFDFTISYTGACSSSEVVPFTGSNTIACGTSIQLTDHNGAANYDNNANGFTVLEAAGSAVVNISGSYNTESSFDNIRIYDGTGTGGTLLETYTGSGTANFTGSPGQTVTVQFTSDGSVTNPGFDFTISYTGACSSSEVVPFTGSNTIACGTSIQLTDHNGAANYDNNANGFTVLEAAGSAVVNISGSYNTESSFDNIRIYDGTGTGGTILETYTGSGTANFTGSPGQTVTVQFTSDGSVTNPGFDFAISYTGACSLSEVVPFTGSNTIACGANTQLTDHNGAADYNNNANGFTVLEAAGSAVVNISGSYSTESCCDFIRIYDGSGTSGTLLQTYNGIGTANFTGTPGQTVTVGFFSDGSVTAPGFDFAISYTGVCIPPPAFPGTCATADVITTGVTSAPGPNSGGGASNNCFGGGGTNANWYEFTTTVTGELTIESISGGDTRVSVYSGACGSLTCEASDDDSGAGLLSLVTLNVCAGETYYIEWDDRWDNIAFDFEVTETALCADPSTATITPTTDGFDATTTWTAGGGDGCPSSNGYQWEVVADGDAPFAGNDIQSGVGTYPVSLAAVTGLSDGTAYDFYVRDDCGGGDFSNAVLTNFTTIPLLFPGTCATADVITTGVTSAPGPNTGGGASNICFGGGGTNANWYEFTTTVTGELTISSDLAANVGLDTRLSVYSGTCGSLTCEASNDDVLSNFLSTVTLNVCAGETYYIEWDDRWDDSAFDFEVTETALCIDPSIATITPTTDGFDATTTWTAGGGDGCPSSNGYQWEVVADGDAPFAGNDIQSGVGTYPVSLAAVTGLSDGTAYDFYVRDDCGGGDFSNAILTDFTTLAALTCANPPINVTHCYGNSADDQFVYTGLTPGDQPAIVINNGTTESGFDDLTIYDGDNTSAPILYTSDGNHSGVSVQSTTGSLLVRIQSDGSVSCQSGSFCCAAGLDWDIFCGAQPGSWVGLVNNDWNNAGNWVGGVIPSAGDDAIIPAAPIGGNFPEVEVDAQVANLTIEAGANVDILAGQSITVSGVLENNGTFTVESDGALVQTTGSSLSGSGTFLVQRSLGVSNPWFVGSPINNQDIFNFGINPIQVVGGDGVQFNPQGSCDPSDIDVPGEFVMQLNEDATIIDDCSNSLWHYRSTGNLTNGRGYAVYTTSGNTLEFQGTVNNGAVTYGGLGRQTGTVTLPNASTLSRGWHLVSNPYPSPITLTGADLTALGFDAQIHRWNAGVWVSSNPLTSVTIAVGQGFQIRKTTEGGAVDFSLDNSFRTTDAATFYKDNNGLGQNLSITLSNEDYESNGFIYFKDEATPDFDPQFDANRLYGLDHIPLVYTKSEDNERLAYNALPLLEADVHTTVPLAVYDGNPGAFTLTFEELNSLETETQNVTVILEDLKLDEMIQISEGTTYDFVTEADDAAERFVVHFYPVAKEIEQEEEEEELEEEEEIEEEEEVLSINDLQNQVIGLFPNPTESKATLMLDMNHTFTNVQVVSITGKVVHAYNVENGQTNVHIDLSGMSAGVYLVQVKGAQIQTVKKLVKQ